MLDPELAALSARLAEVGARNAASTVATRIAAARTAKRDQETINALEEIVSELIADRAEVMGIAQAYEEQLVAQRISDDDVDFITSELVPKLQEMLHRLGQTAQAEEVEKITDALDALLSKEMLRLLQVIGFNFKMAIGEPLTDLVARAITSKAPLVPADPESVHRLSLENQTALARLSQDPDAYARFASLFDGSFRR